MGFFSISLCFFWKILVVVPWNSLDVSGCFRCHAVADPQLLIYMPRLTCWLACGDSYSKKGHGKQGRGLIDFQNGCPTMCYTECYCICRPELTRMAGQGAQPFPFFAGYRQHQRVCRELSLDTQSCDGQ